MRNKSTYYYAIESILSNVKVIMLLLAVLKAKGQNVNNLQTALFYTRYVSCYCFYRLLLQNAWHMMEQNTNYCTTKPLFLLYRRDITELDKIGKNGCFVMIGTQLNYQTSDGFTDRWKLIHHLTCWD